MQVVILAGGLGTRLRPMTQQVPKPMVEVNGRPFLEYIVRHLADQGFVDTLMLVGYLGEQVEHYFGDGHQLGISIDYSYEPTPLGTAGAIRHALPKLDDSFLLLYGDSFLPIDYGQVTDAFTRSACEGLVVIYDNDSSDTGVPNNIDIDGTGYVARYDKTGPSELRYVEAGALCLYRRVFTALTAGTVVSLEQELFPELISNHQLASFVTTQRFFDIGTPARLTAFTSYNCTSVA